MAGALLGAAAPLATSAAGAPTLLGTGMLEATGTAMGSFIRGCLFGDEDFDTNALGRGPDVLGTMGPVARERELDLGREGKITRGGTDFGGRGTSDFGRATGRVIFLGGGGGGGGSAASKKRVPLSIEETKASRTTLASALSFVLRAS